jgi:4-hydroxyphenylacetate 3-monooxygenase
MTRSLGVTIEAADGTTRPGTMDIRRMYNLGSATRDPQTAVAHQQEVAKSGIHIAFDVPAPRIYPIALHALTTDDEVFVQTDRTSGEVEIVIHVGDEVYVGVGSDHTDRAMETVSIPGSKQACANHLAPTLWPYAAIRDVWDTCILRSWVDGRLYQEVGVNAFIRPEDILEILRARVPNMPQRDFTVFCGTIVSVDKELGFGADWRYELEMPGTGRRIGASYSVVDILSEVAPDYRVPFFNPRRGDAAS